MNKIYDIIILGGGPAGYTAALYASRAGFDTLVIEKFSAGGQMTQTSEIDNYPGFEEGIDGFTLGLKMQKSAERFGAQTIRTLVTKVELEGKIKTIETDDGIFSAKTVIIATGAEHKHLGIDKEKELTGRGVSYCAACDGMFFRGKTVAVVGGGNSAAHDALYLSNICEKVILIHRRDTLRAEKVYREPLLRAGNIQFEWNTTVSELLADEKVYAVKVKNSEGVEKNIDIDGIFISIGRAPQTELFRNKLKLDSNGYIIADESTVTNLPGVFAAGDVRAKHFRQIVTAVADGASASHFAEEYLSGI